MENCPFFHTHHAPVGAWASLTFGAPGVGVSIDFQQPNVKNSGSLVAGIAANGQIRSIGFANRPKAASVSLTAEGDKEKKTAVFRDPLQSYGLYDETQLRRTLTPCTDTFYAENLRFSTYTPCAPLPDPAKETISAVNCLPGIIMDITADNTAGTAPCTVFLGLFYADMKQVYAFEDETLYSIRYRDDWMFAAQKQDGVFMVRGLDAAHNLSQGKAFVHENGPCFLCMNVPAGKTGTLTVGWSVYASCGSNGAKRTAYYYNRYFHNLDETARAVLLNASALREAAAITDEHLLSARPDKARAALFSQAVRGYYASTQLLQDNNGGVLWNVCEGAYLWRNTMDLCADHIVWELRQNPWVVRCLMDEFIAEYSYRDRVTFAGKPGDYPGGLSFTHDMGCGYTYAKPGNSAYERANDSAAGFYFYMTTEELLNGIYCMAGYALRTGDREWLVYHRAVLKGLMDSLENRDAPSEAERNGILKASSVRTGACALESTTYDALDHSLLEAAGNLYVFIKTWCALVMLTRCCVLADEEALAARAQAMLEKCRRSLQLFVNDGCAVLKANAYRDIPGAVAAAVEPLSVPYWLGVLNAQQEPLLFETLRRHCTACLQKVVCIDETSGGLRLSSTSRNTWPSKAVLTLYAAQNALGLALPPQLEKRVIAWAQESARETTIADQILCDTEQVVGGPYYPRIVTAALWL